MGNSKSKQNKKRYQGQDKKQFGKQGDGRKQDQGENQEQSSESVREFSSFIKRKADDLVYLMTTQFGLLDTLVSNNVLSSKQVALVQEKNTSTSEVRQLLKGNQFQKKGRMHFLIHLTKQRHVSTLIRGTGQRAAEYGEHWPLYLCTEYNGINVNRSTLLELMDSTNSLFDDIFSECIDYKQKRPVEE